MTGFFQRQAEDRRRDNRRIKAGLTLATWCDIYFENDGRVEDRDNLKVALKEFQRVMEETSV